MTDIPAIAGKLEEILACLPGAHSSVTANWTNALDQPMTLTLSHIPDDDADTETIVSMTGVHR